MPSDLRDALRVSVMSVAWTVATGCAAIAIGIGAGSAVLVAFGSVGLVDGAGSAALVHHFRHALRHAGLADHLERIAHRIVLAGLLVVGVLAILLGALRLAAADHGDASAAGTGLAAVSLVVLVGLATAKQRIATRVGSPALRSDGHLSGVGAAQAAVTVVGVAASAAGWWWADPSAAIAIGSVAVGIGVRTAR